MTYSWREVREQTWASGGRTQYYMIRLQPQHTHTTTRTHAHTHARTYTHTHTHTVLHHLHPCLIWASSLIGRGCVSLEQKADIRSLTKPNERRTWRWRSVQSQASLPPGDNCPSVMASVKQHDRDNKHAVFLTQSNIWNRKWKQRIVKREHKHCVSFV